MDLVVQRVPDSQEQVCPFPRRKELLTDDTLRQVIPVFVDLARRDILSISG